VIRASAFAVVLLVVAALLGATRGEAGSSQATKLVGSVGPGFGISLRDAQGNAVTRVDPGTYEIEVTDLADAHTFHLRGLGVDQRTEVAFTGTVSWTVTFQNGTYTFFCDVHPTQMRGTFTSGSAPAPAPPQSNPVTARTRLVLTAGPAEIITLKTAAGRVVKTMKRGTYRMTVRDRSAIHNAHVVAPGFNKRTMLAFRGTQTWRVPLRRTGTLRFLCDPHAAIGMRGSAKIVP
jgi:plastocyanin